MHVVVNQGQGSRDFKRVVIGVCLLVSAIAATKIYHWYGISRMESPYLHKIPRIKWTQPLDRRYPVWAAPVVGKDGALYVAATDGVRAIDPSSVLRWEYRMSADDAIMRGGFLQDDAGNFYLATATDVYSLTANGIKRWQADCPRAAFAKTVPGPADANSLYTTCDTHFAALRKSDGHESWNLPGFETQRPSMMPEPPLMLSNGTLIFTKDQHIFATDHAGNVLWTYPSDDHHAGYLLDAGANGTLYAENFFSGLTAVDASTGSEKWSFQGGTNVGFQSSPVIAPDGTIYVVAARGPVYALADDGTALWMLPLPPKQAGSQGYSSPVLGSDGTIYLLLDHSVMAVSSGGKMLWQLDLPGPPISNGFLALAVGGTLYVVTDDAMIHAVQTASPGPARKSGGSL